MTAIESAPSEMMALLREDAAEVVGVGKDIFLHREEDAGGVDEVTAMAQLGHHGDGLGADDLQRPFNNACW